MSDKQKEIRGQIVGTGHPRVCPLIGKPCIEGQCVAWDNLNGQCIQFPGQRTVKT